MGEGLVRQRVDGKKFEEEFKRAFEDYFYVHRLHTVKTGYAGVRQPADFIVIGKKVTYVELKETKAKSFSIATMQQLDAMKDFVLRTCFCPPVNYLLVVNFIGGKIATVTGEFALSLLRQHKTLTLLTAQKHYSNLAQLREDFENDC